MPILTGAIADMICANVAGTQRRTDNPFAGLSVHALRDRRNVLQEEIGVLEDAVEFGAGRHLRRALEERREELGQIMTALDGKQAGALRAGVAAERRAG